MASAEPPHETAPSREGTSLGTAGPRPPEETNQGDGARVEKANMLPRRGRRRFGVERLLMRLVATAGIVGIGVALGAILVASKVQGWITGLVVALTAVVLSALLWSSRQL